MKRFKNFQFALIAISLSVVSIIVPVSAWAGALEAPLSPPHSNVAAQAIESSIPNATLAVKEAPLEEIRVTGIRRTCQGMSMKIKRNSESIVEVITAEDIGKMPDKLANWHRVDKNWLRF